MLINALTIFARSYYAGDSSQFVFKAQRAPVFPEEEIKNISLYIHIPFCFNACPYCPYNKIQFQKELAESYFTALHEEIELYRHRLGSIKINSVYFGGGSPAIMPYKVLDILQHLSRIFSLEGDICIELNPNDCDPDHLKILQSAGVNVVSVGIQSFQDKFLLLTGRNYNGIRAEDSLAAAKSLFNSVNVDLMFALPGQGKNDIIGDIETAISLRANQITTYPLFTFPYTSVGRYKKLSSVKMPNLIKRKEQYYSIYDKLLSNDYNQVSVWSFKKGDGQRYSSVTRDGYLGLGAGAGTHFQNGYLLNTFSIPAYISAIRSGNYPTALLFKLDNELNNLFWLYWRFYDTKIPVNEYIRKFEHNKKIQKFLYLLIRTGFIKRIENDYVMTRNGSFWLHLAQNYFSLEYINRIWTRALTEDFPDDIYF